MSILSAAKLFVRRAQHCAQRCLARLLPALVRSERNRIRLLQAPRSFGEHTAPSALALDVLYVTLESELPVLEQSLRSLRLHLRHPIGAIHVVSAESAALREFCRRNDCRWQEETTVLGFGPQSLQLRVNGRDRSGWLFQQLIKLSADRISGAAQVLVLDADTVLLSPQVFEQDGKHVLLVSDEFHLPYRRIYQRLLGQAPPRPFSFVAHQMLLDTQALSLLRAEIEANGQGESWWQRIRASYDEREGSGFSEYELYGNWYSTRHPERVQFDYWFNRALPRRQLQPLEQLQRRWAGESVRSVSFHHYL